MSFPDLTAKIKVNDKQLLTERQENTCEKIEILEEEKIGKKYKEKLSEYIAILLPKSEKEKLEEIASQEERSVSYMARKAIKQIYKI